MSLRFSEDSTPVPHLVANDQICAIRIHMVKASTKEILYSFVSPVEGAANKQRFVHDAVCATRIVHRGFLRNVDCELRLEGLTTSE